MGESRPIASPMAAGQHQGPEFGEFVHPHIRFAGKVLGRPKKVTEAKKDSLKQTQENKHK